MHSIEVSNVRIVMINNTHNIKDIALDRRWGSYYNIKTLEWVDHPEDSLVPGRPPRAVVLKVIRGDKDNDN